MNCLYLQASSLLERHHCHEARAVLKETQLIDHLPLNERLFHLILYLSDIVCIIISCYVMQARSGGFDGRHDLGNRR